MSNPNKTRVKLSLTMEDSRRPEPARETIIEFDTPFADDVDTLLKNHVKSMAPVMYMLDQLISTASQLRGVRIVSDKIGGEDVR